MAEGEDNEDSQKTEEPTAKKLEEARKRGQVAMSRELNSWLMLLAAAILLGTMAPGMMKELAVLMSSFIEHSHDIRATPSGMHYALHDSFWAVVKIMAMPLLLLMGMAALAPFVQIGPLFAPQVIKPDLSKLSPVKGWSRLFSMRSIMEFVKGLIKICIIGAVCIMIVKPYFGQMEHMVGLPIPLLLVELMDLTMKMMIGIVVVMMVIAALDVFYQRFEHHKKMRMTKQEVRDEYKQAEGDPHVKAKLRQIRGERARKRMMQNVPRADVIITNPTHFSIALRYDPNEMDAPQCIAKGVNELALRIREVAKEHNIEIYESPPLARALYDVMDVDDYIPAEHFKAVAEIISFVFKKQGKFKTRGV